MILHPVNPVHPVILAFYYVIFAIFFAAEPLALSVVYAGDLSVGFVSVASPLADGGLRLGARNAAFKAPFPQTQTPAARSPPNHRR